MQALCESITANDAGQDHVSVNKSTNSPKTMSLNPSLSHLCHVKRSSEQKCKCKKKKVLHFHVQSNYHGWIEVTVKIILLCTMFSNLTCILLII